MNTLKDIDREKVVNLIGDYASPWGCMSKREFETRLFATLIESGVVTSNIYDIMSQLCVTRQKARNLLYEYNLRKFTATKDNQQLLLDELFNMLVNPIIGEDQSTSTIKLQVENPYMIDYIKNLFIKKHILVDGSFSPEIITINKHEFMWLFTYCCINDKKRKDILKSRGIVIEDKLLKTTSNIISSLSSVFLGKLGEKAGEGLFELLEISDIPEQVCEWFNNILFSEQSNKSAL